MSPHLGVFVVKGAHGFLRSKALRGFKERKDLDAYQHLDWAG